MRISIRCFFIKWRSTWVERILRVSIIRFDSLFFVNSIQCSVDCLIWFIWRIRMCARWAKRFGLRFLLLLLYFSMDHDVTLARRSLDLSGWTFRRGFVWQGTNKDGISVRSGSECVCKCYWANRYVTVCMDTVYIFISGDLGHRGGGRR